MIDRAALTALIHRFDLDDYAETILAHARPGIHIRRTRVADEAEIPVGASKLGGSPDVPADFIWQTWQGMPLTFIAQFKLSEVAPYDVEKLLPLEGMLYFFYDVEHLSSADLNPGGWYVAYHPNEINLRRVPNQTKHDFSLYPCQVTFEQMYKLRSDWDSQFLKMRQFPEVAVNQYFKLAASFESHPSHFLFGHAEAIQNPMEIECAFIAAGFSLPYPYKQHNQYELEAAKWRLLLQIDTDDVPDGHGMIWGDVGRIYFWIHQDRLATRDFSGVLTFMQCT
ncbi:MAG: YwqG family protein [Chloroflexota bacterium]|nr:YwqG family protein [Chloroflexota bacterium]